MVEEQEVKLEPKKAPTKKDAEQLIDSLADSAIKFAQTISSIPAVQAGIASDMVRSGLKNMVNSGLVAAGEAGDEAKIAKLVGDKLGVKDKEAQNKDKKDTKEPGKVSSTGEQTAGEQSKEFKAPEANTVEVEKLYDKFSAPPRVTPPPPLEEYRGDVFMPPAADVPLEFQLPERDRERRFIAPDPLMKSADVIGPDGLTDEERAKEAEKSDETPKSDEAPKHVEPTHSGPSKEFQHNPQSKEKSHK